MNMMRIFIYLQAWLKIYNHISACTYKVSGTWYQGTDAMTVMLEGPVEIFSLLCSIEQPFIDLPRTDADDGCDDSNAVAVWKKAEGKERGAHRICFVPGTNGTIIPSDC